MNHSLLLDEMFSALAAEMLREVDVDAIAVNERPDLRSSSDDEVLSAAAREGRVVVTFNYRDFIMLDKQRRAAGLAHNGVLIVNSRRYSNSKPGLTTIVEAIARLAKGDRNLNGLITWL